MDKKRRIVIIGDDDRCMCSCATPCPIGKAGMAGRCTIIELVAMNVSVVSKKFLEENTPGEVFEAMSNSDLAAVIEEIIEWNQTLSLKENSVIATMADVLILQTHSQVESEIQLPLLFESSKRYVSLLSTVNSAIGEMDILKGDFQSILVLCDKLLQNAKVEQPNLRETLATILKTCPIPPKENPSADSDKDIPDQEN